MPLRLLMAQPLGRHREGLAMTPRDAPSHTANIHSDPRANCGHTRYLADSGYSLRPTVGNTAIPAALHPKAQMVPSWCKHGLRIIRSATYLSCQDNAEESIC